MSAVFLSLYQAQIRLRPAIITHRLWGLIRPDIEFSFPSSLQVSEPKSYPSGNGGFLPLTVVKFWVNLGTHCESAFESLPDRDIPKQPTRRSRLIQTH